MTHEFTPGPWAKFGPGNPQIYGGDPFRRICVLDHMTGARMEECYANAALIAAAPGMLAELESVAAVLARLGFGAEDADISGGDTVEAMAEAWPSIVAMIAKARGT